jgi:hypothetical protein
VGDDLVEEVAGIQGIFVGGLDEADDAFGVGGDQKRKVSGGELGESCWWNDEGGGAAKKLNCGFGWLGRGGLVRD